MLVCNAQGANRWCTETRHYCSEYPEEQSDMQKINFYIQRISRPYRQSMRSVLD